MPYSGPDDSNLPKNVKKMPMKMRKQWVSVFESSMSAGDDESTAFAKANGVSKKSKGLIEIYDLDTRSLTKDQAKYSPVGMMDNEACASCHWHVSPDSCIMVWGDISPTGKCSMWMDSPEDMLLMAEEKDVEEETLIQKVLRRVKEAFSIGPVQPAEPIKPMVFFKQADGKTRFFTIYTNCFKDSHEEIVTDAAHREYVYWVTKSDMYPELHLWHAGEKSKWGKVDWMDYCSGFVAASGLVDEGKEYIAEALEKQDIAVSQGLVGIGNKKTIRLYRTFEISPLPFGKAANNWVDFTLRSKEMPFSEPKKKWLKDVAHLDDETITTWEKSVDKLSDNLKALGIEYKEQDDTDLVSIISKQTTAIEQLATAVASIKQVIDAELPVIKQKQDDLSKGFDERVADAFLARVAKSPGGFIASESKENVIAGNKEDQVNKDRDWFTNVVTDLIKTV